MLMNTSSSLKIKSPVCRKSQNTSPTEKKYVAYYRVSTQGQGESGLGLAAQETAVRRGVGKVEQCFTDTESGKCSERPGLHKALTLCKASGATLVVAKLDRLARNVLFTATLMESGVEFIACDLPSANKLTIHIMAALAEEETRMISARTKAALAEAKAKGVLLGSRRPGFVGGAVPKGTKRPTISAELIAQMKQLRSRGDSYAAIATAVNEQGHRTCRGNEWDRRATFRVLKAASPPATTGREAA